VCEGGAPEGDDVGSEPPRQRACEGERAGRAVLGRGELTAAERRRRGGVDLF
jgi:hypothetical protein